MKNMRMGVYLVVAPDPKIKALYYKDGYSEDLRELHTKRVRLKLENEAHRFCALVDGNKLPCRWKWVLLLDRDRKLTETLERVFLKKGYRRLYEELFTRVFELGRRYERTLNRLRKKPKTVKKSART